MGYAEEAQVQLGKAKQQQGDAATLAAAYASLAVMERLDSVIELLGHLADKLEDDEARTEMRRSNSLNRP